MNLLRKVFSLYDIKYVWLLLVSMVLCGGFFYLDRSYNPDDQFWLSVGYGVSFGIALLWSAMNYIGHIRINVLYRKQNDIQAYVEQLAMNKEDQAELRNYLEDYAQDLMSQGKSEAQATAEAISQFKVKELLSLSKNSSLFDLHAHYYLFGWSVVFFTLLILLVGVDGLFFGNSLLTLIVETILTVYGAAWIFLFFIYKLLDSLIYRMYNHVS